MAHWIHKRVFYVFSITALVLSVFFVRASAQALEPGDFFPDFKCSNNLDTPECDYLGIAPAGSLYLGSLKQDIVILEFLNVFCDMCREDAELYNELYEISQSDPELSGTFAVLGIAVGNSFEEVMQFSDELFVRYPILLDPEQEILSLTGSVRGAPQTYLLKRQGDRYIIRNFSRSATSKDEYLSQVRKLQRSNSDQGAMSTQGLSYCFMAEGVKYTEQNFPDSRVLLYFPHERSYPQKSDTRNTDRQIDVLCRVLKLHPEMKVIILEQSKNPISALKGLKLPPGFTRAICDNGLFDQLASKDHPTVCYIDTNGSAVFKGQALTLSALRSMIEKGRYQAEPDMLESDIVNLISSTLIKQDACLQETIKTEINGHPVYLTRTNNPGRFYYSRLESSPSLCDLCHDSHFIYSVDSRGTIVALIPIALPKRGNVDWTTDEVAAFQARFKGKNIQETFQFNAEADAITGATITSSIVYERLNRGKKLFKQIPAPLANKPRSIDTARTPNSN